MTKVFVDPDLNAKLDGVDEPVELCDTAGKTLGFFYPVTSTCATEPAHHSCSPIAAAEIESRRQQRTGKPLAEILDRLNRS